MEANIMEGFRKFKLITDFLDGKSENLTINIEEEATRRAIFNIFLIVIYLIAKNNI